MQHIHTIVETLRARVAADPRLGWILEEDREVPAKALAQGWLPKDVRRRWADPSPGVALPEHLRANLPLSYVELLSRYGSLHWIAPLGYDGDLSHSIRNSGPEAFLALYWLAYVDVGDLIPDMPDELVDGIEIFHDGTLTGAAFDNRVRNSAGEHLVVEDFDESSCHALVESPGIGTKTFAEWIDRHITVTKQPAKTSLNGPASRRNTGDPPWKSKM